MGTTFCGMLLYAAADAMHPYVQEKKQPKAAAFFSNWEGWKESGMSMEGRGRKSSSSGRRRTYRASYAYDRRKMAATYRKRTARRRRGNAPVPGGRWGKFAAIVIGTALLVFLLLTTIRTVLLPGPKGEYLNWQEAENLTRLLADTAGRADEAALAALFARETDSEATGLLDYATWKEIAALFPECGYELPDGYRNRDSVLLSDWYDFFDAARGVYDTQGLIQDVSLTPIGIGKDVLDQEGTALAEDMLISSKQAYRFRTDRVRDCLFLPVTAIVQGQELYAVRSVDGADSELSNIWIMEVEENALRCFWNDYELRIPTPLSAQEMGAQREQIAVLGFTDGALNRVHIRQDKVSGRLLKVLEDGVEVEGQGFLPFAEELKIYRLYGKLKKYYTSDLCIGYDFADFVLENGQVQAALVVKEEAMENIRVLVKTSGYGSAYHDVVELQADCDLQVITGEYGSEQTQILPAGEMLTIGRDSALFASDHIRIQPEALTGRIRLLNVERNQGIPSYRGSLELEREADGIVVINELLLEEYLYAVVPSEMPSTYPLEALKAQAVCARTYAYAKMLHAGLPTYGAHVDDSSAFQVYNNITENADTTKAVKETKGELLYYGEELAEAYYYSTSCGYGTDTGIWQASDPEQFPYLQAKAVNVAGVTDAEGDTIDENVREEDISAADAMEAEEAFAAFITGSRESDFEQEEAWYRWTYQVEQIDPEVLYANIVKRYEASPSCVFVRQADGSYVNQSPVDPGRITDIYVAARNTGGVAEELVIEGENAALMIRTEHNIRYVLSDGSSQVIRQDGSTYQATSLLPSAFFILQTQKKDGYVSGYSLIGGGFGHGVGMSQNGARSMAQAGCDSGNILSFFYKGSSVRKIY